jgi:protein-L-isoaspartate(D-aspartate) O-methyltransferase
MSDYEGLRLRMVEEQLRARGIKSERVLDAFRRVPRQLFLPVLLRDYAYEDHPVGIGANQTISQPYMVATMTEALELRGAEKVLEIGTGSGYQTAILLAMGADVYTVERLPELSEWAKENLEQAGVGHAHFKVGDGTLGWPEEAPFDRVIVTAGAPSLPVSLVQQLSEGGSMAIPVGDETEQELFVLKREDGFVKKKKVCACTFVKLVGAEGWGR